MAHGHAGTVTPAVPVARARAAARSRGAAWTHDTRARAFVMMALITTWLIDLVVTADRLMEEGQELMSEDGGDPDLRRAFDWSRRACGGILYATC